MPKSLPSHVNGLLAYLSKPDEKANEDLALSYFRQIFGDSFKRQKEAKRSDGYVAGHFVLELKGNSNDWLSALFQGLAYKNLELDFAQIVVAAKNFLAIWQVEDIPEELRDEVSTAKGAPNVIGRSLSRKYGGRKNELLRLTTWNGGVELSGSLFASHPDLIVDKIRNFEKTLREGRKVRQKITLQNFTSALKEMVVFFAPEQPVKAVRAFYSMLYGWTETATIQLSDRTEHKATLAGESITDLLPIRRRNFKEYVENHFIYLAPGEDKDDFFARYDEALDAVDKDFRVRHGIFFTDRDLSKLVMWIVKQHIPNLGKNYLVIDPACGSGNLVTNWRSPLELRHKVVSEIEPELLFAVERRMKGDQWHNGKFTVVPKVDENRGLNFLDVSAEEYLEEIRCYLADKGHKPDRPLAFLCNPPYKNDDDRLAYKKTDKGKANEGIGYKVHDSIIKVTGVDASSERYCCFLAQMKLICDAARTNGLPDDSLLLLFTKSSWLTKRAVFANIRFQMLEAFEDVTGALVRGNEFFDVKGTWPIAFTVWRYRAKELNLNPHRSIPLLDLTWLKKEQLAQIPWDEQHEMETACRRIITSPRTHRIAVGEDRISIREWSGRTMLDFKRGRRKGEANQRIVGGLPLGDHRQQNKKAYGETLGRFIGFMDDLTPCRVKNSEVGKPWFRLNNQFMDFKKNRCFSGPPTHWGYCASDLQAAKKLCFWYSLARTFIQKPYPMWVDADDMWEPTIPEDLEQRVFGLAFAITYAENECIEARFPAHNPVSGAPALTISNPMTPLNPESFWSKTLIQYIERCDCPNTRRLVGAVDAVFDSWKNLFRNRTEIPITGKAYLLDSDGLTVGAGVVQIRDYATDEQDKGLLTALSEVQNQLKVLKADFFELLSAKNGLDYFGASLKKSSPVFDLPQKTKFDKVLAKRLTVAAIFVDQLHDDPHFGRTKLAKLFYLADVHEELNLETQYFREAAGPLDQRALYNERIGIEATANKYELFATNARGKMFRYRPGRKLKNLIRAARQYLGADVEGVERIAELFKPLDTDQSEIVATLYACWNDFLIRNRRPTDAAIADEFLHGWHQQKARFSKSRLIKALAWMRRNAIQPRGVGSLTRSKPFSNDQTF